MSAAAVVVGPALSGSPNECHTPASRSLSPDENSNRVTGDQTVTHDSKVSCQSFFSGHLIAGREIRSRVHLILGGGTRRSAASSSISCGVSLNFLSHHPSIYFPSAPIPLLPDHISA